VKNGSTTDVAISDHFTFNTTLPAAHPPRRFAIPPTSGKIIRTVSVTTTANVSTERKFKVDAAIVRIMKARRRLHINELTAEVLQQLHRHFQPDAKLIKRCIESLQEREYLDRDTTDQNVFIYQA